LRFTSSSAWKASALVFRNGRLAAAPALATTICGGPQTAAASPNLVGPGHVAGHEAHLGAGDLGERLRTAAGDRHLRAGAEQRPRDRRADAAAAAGDERMLGLKRRHQTLPSICSLRSASRQSWSRPGR
jgi:hypothetical protein